MPETARRASGEGRLSLAASMLGVAALLAGTWRARRAPRAVRRPATVVPDPPTGPLGALDAAQRRTTGLSFVAAVVKKFNDDGGGRLAAQLTYSGFLSLFPLLLVLTTVLGYVLDGRPDLEERVLNSALVQFPIIGDQLASSVGSLRGSAVALAVGLVTALWGGLGVTQAAQEILANVWMVPRRERPGFLPRLGRAVAVLVVLVAGLVGTTALAGLGSQLPDLGWFTRMALVAAAVAVNALWFTVAFRILMPVPVGWADAAPGAVVAAVGWQALLLVGSTLVERQLRGATQSYGFFGIVLGLLAWLALASTLLVLCAELNAVRYHRLWPRSLITPALTEDDRRALAATARIEERAAGERIDVAFGPPDDVARAS